MNRVVIAYLFDPTLTKVVMIQKRRPDWMEGLFNAPGGHVEEGETFEDANVREFYEETGVQISSTFWNKFLELNRSDRVIIGYWWISYSINKVKTVTDEQVAVCDVESLLSRPDELVRDVSWILPMAQSAARNGPNFDSFYVVNDTLRSADDNR